MNRPFKNFRGDIDAFLEHCSKIDPQPVVEDENVMFGREEMIDVTLEKL